MLKIDRQKAHLYRSSRRKSSAPSCGRCFSGTRTATCSTSIKACSNSASTVSGRSRASSITSVWRAIPSAGRTPRSECSRSSTKALRRTSLPAGVTFTDDDAITAFSRVWGHLIQRIPGDPWKSSKVVIEEIRKANIPALLSGVHE
jgi:hypothetical protein